jgi:hypothetical protein
MASLGEHEYEMLGRRVVANLGADGDLNSAAANVAEQERFNPDQIRRLVEFTNTAAFLRRLEGAGGNAPPNPAEEFEPAQHGLVIRIILDRGGSVPGDAPAPDFDDVTSSFPEVALKDPSAKGPPASAQETEEEMEEPETPRARGEKREAAHRALDRVLERVTERFHQARMAFDASAAHLHEVTRRRPSLLDEVEKVGFNLYASDPIGLSVLRQMREGLGLAALNDADVRRKQAACPVTYDRTAIIELVDELVKHGHEAVRYRRAKEYLSDHLR